MSTGCTSGIDAVGYGTQLIEDGDVDVVVAGASDAPISPISIACFDTIRATSARNDDPEHASRPFDATRDGFVMGEGGAVLILEEYEHARARDAHIYCEVRGFANRCNAFHMTGLKPDGVEMSVAIDDALRQGRIDPTAVDYVNAHGSGTKQNDRHETAAVKRSLGAHAYDIAMSSIKSMVGPLARSDRLHRTGRLRPGDRARGGSPHREPGDPRPRLRPGLRAQDRPGSAGRRRGVGGQRVRRIPVRDRPGQAGGGGVTQPTRRAVITGIGVVAPTGIGAAAHWRSVLAGKLGVRRIAAFDPTGYAATLAGQVDGLPRRRARRRAARRPDGSLDLNVAGRHPAGPGRRGVRPGRARPVPDLGGPGGRIGRQRVRAAGDDRAVQQGTEGRRGLPVDRVVLRREHRSVVDPPRHQRPARACW